MADKDKLIAYPMIEELDYRGNIDSKQLNSMLKSIEESVLRAILRGTELQEKINRLSLGVNSAYRSLESHNQIYNQYPKVIDLPEGEYGGVSFATAFESILGTGRQYKAAGIATMNWEDKRKLSKIPVYDGKVNPSVTIYVDGILRQPDDPVYNIIDGDPSNFWVEATTSGVHTLELNLPPSISKKFNYLEIIPFPIFGIDITNIQYSDLQSVSHSIYPTKDNPFYNKSGPLVLHLSPREFNNTITITFSVKSGVNTMGFSLIDIANIDYLDNSSTLIIPCENIPQPSKFDHNGNPFTGIDISEVFLDFYVDGVIDDKYDSFISEISLMNRQDGSGSFNIKLQKTRKPQLISAPPADLVQSSGDNALFLKFVINEVNLTSPVIRGASIRWREIS
jgi:hypothetical protein